MTLGYLPTSARIESPGTTTAPFTVRVLLTRIRRLSSKVLAPVLCDKEYPADRLCPWPYRTP